jgi:multidrug efflux pump subunit AcrA (membrane-fusion protein)
MIRSRSYARCVSLQSSAVALAALPFLAACNKKQERPQRPVATVQVIPARRATVPYIIEANGIVTPMQSASVTAQVDGIVQSVDFQEGQEVRQGQPLFHVDPRPYQNTYAQAAAVLARDSANWLNAKANADRSKQLLSAKVITQQEADVNLTAAATAEATIRADHASLEQAKFNLENTIIRAPISGKTGSLLVKRGNLVRSGGGTPLVVINQVRPILVRFAIPSSQLPLVLQYGSGGGLQVAAVPGGIAPPTPPIDSLAAAAMAPVNDGGSDGAALRSGNDGGNGSGGRRGRKGTGADGGSVGSADGAAGGFGSSAAHGGPNGGNGGNPAVGGPPGGGAGSTNGSGAGARGMGSGGRVNANGAQPVQQGGVAGERVVGKLSFIDNAVDTATGTVQLKASFDNSNGRLWAGQFATTSLHLFDQDSALVVPAQAIVTGQRGSYVYVVDRADTARQRGVVVERTAGGLAIIASGIRDGDRVVIEGQSRLTPDAPVRIRGANDAGGFGGGGGRKGGRKGGGQGGGQGGPGGQGGGRRGGG